MVGSLPEFMVVVNIAYKISFVAIPRKTRKRLGVTIGFISMAAPIYEVKMTVMLFIFCPRNKRVRRPPMK